MDDFDIEFQMHELRTREMYREADNKKTLAQLVDVESEVAFETVKALSETDYAYEEG